MTGEEALRRLVRGRLRATARRAWEAALRRVDPEPAVERVLADEDGDLVAAGHRFPRVERVIVLGWGKAAVPMLRAASRLLGRRIVDGLIVTKDGHDEGLTRLGAVKVQLAAHPVPDARGEAGARALLELAGSCRPGDLALVLGSGGGSALLACPAEGLELEDLQVVTSLLLRSGADIHEMNAVRKHLSSFAGGRLARALPCRSLTLLVSDVPGDDVSCIASGPTVPDPTTYEDALAVVRRRLGKSAPKRIVDHLRRGAAGALEETPKPGTIDPERHVALIVASLRDAIDATRDALVADRLGTRELGALTTGDVADVAPAHLRAALEGTRATGRPIALVGGGEATVVVAGDGAGGRNQHLACVAARELAAMAERGELATHEVVLASVATDGTDGPTSAAGGMVDCGTWARARRAGVDPDALLARFDSNAILRASGDLLVTGPTRTNVMDLHLCLAAPLGPGTTR